MLSDSDKIKVAMRMCGIDHYVVLTPSGGVDDNGLATKMEVISTLGSRERTIQLLSEIVKLLENGEGQDEGFNDEPDSRD